MNRILWKDLLVEIRRSLGRYLSILAITALGVAFFAGIKASAPDMKYSADSYFDKYHLQDIQVFSTIGLTEKDLDELKKVPGVQDVQGQFTSDYLARQDARELTVRLLSYQNGQPLNQPRLIEGRMPENDQECLVQGSSATGQILGSFEIGDTINLRSPDETPIEDSLNRSSFQVVGKAFSPNYLSYDLGSSSAGSGKADTFIYVLQSAVHSDLFTEIDLSVRDALAVNSYTDAYFDLVEPVVEQVENIAGRQIETRIESMRKEVDDQEKEAQEQFDKGQKELDQAKKKLDDAKKQIDDSSAQVARSLQALEEADLQIASGQDQLAAGQNTLDANEQAVDAALFQIEQAAARKPELESQKSQLETAIASYEALETAKAAITQAQAAVDSLQKQIDALLASDPDSEQLPALQAAFEQASARLLQLCAAAGGADSSSKALGVIDQQQKAILSAIGGSIEQARLALDSVNQGIAQIEQAQAQLPALRQSKEQLQAARQTLLAQAAALDQAIAQRQNGQAQLDQGQSELASAQGEYEQGLADYNKEKEKFESEKKKALDKIADARKQIDDLDAKWIVLDRNSHYSFRDYQSCADRMDGIASVFPVFFFLVAALVCMTTMTRMVDEQRNEMGTLKALGYSKGAIAAKYLIYAGSASVFGSIIGCAAGMYVFPSIIYSAWNIIYNLEGIQFEFQPGLMLLASASATGVVLLAAGFSIHKELREIPAKLMRPKSAKAGKRILLERASFFWKKLSFMQKVTLRNLFRYKKRFFMTVIGISGCSALLVAGFGLNDSISDIVPRQYGAIYHYNAQISAEGDNIETLAQEIEHLDGVEQTASIRILPVTVRYDDKDVSASLNIVSDPKEFDSFMSFLPLDKGSPLELADGGALLSVKTAEKMNLHTGDKLTFKTDDDQTVQIPVAGIFEQYTGHQIYITEKTFQSLKIREEPGASILLQTESDDPVFENELGAKIMEHDEVKSLTFYTSMIENFLNMISSIKMVVVVLVLSAAMLAFVVLYNLSNVNISERMREIATIKVLGFTDREVSQYVNRESLLLALIGSAAGLVLGIYLHDLIMNLAELDTIRFGRTIFWQSYVYSMALTMLFAFMVGWIMQRRLKKIEMVESLKAVE